MQPARVAPPLPPLGEMPASLPSPGPRDWTLAVLPDTQCYAESWPRHFEAQTRWLRDARDAWRIAAVVHVGDIVDDNQEATQWEGASRAMHLLDGHIPYVLAIGNHDMGGRDWADTRETQLDRWFRARDRSAFPALVETRDPDCLESSAHVIETPAGQWLVLALEFGPRDRTRTWAKDLLRRHRDKPCVLVTHAYLYFDGTRYDRQSRPDQRWSPYGYGVARLPGGVADGADLWRDVIAPAPNVSLVLSGHVLDGRARLESERTGGKPVHQVVSNYQDLPEGGSGLLRLMTFRPDAGTIEVRTWSPVLGRASLDPRDQFVLRM